MLSEVAEAPEGLSRGCMTMVLLEGVNLLLLRHTSSR